MPDDVRAMTDADRIAELERKMECIVKYFDPDSPKVYSADDCHRDLTTPPPKPRPKIGVVASGAGQGCYLIHAGNFFYDVQEGWWTRGGGTSFLNEDHARAIAAALEAAGNYPKEER